jgi:hypothetical protein
MNTEQNRVNLDTNQRQEIKDAAVNDLQYDTTLQANILALLATNPAPNVGAFLHHFHTVRALINGWVNSVYSDPHEADVAREAIYNEAVTVIKEAVTEHRGTYEAKNTQFLNVVSSTVGALRTARNDTMQRWSTISAGGITIPATAITAYNAFIAALDVHQDHFMGRQALSTGITVTDFADINTHILDPITTAFNNFINELNGVTPTAGSAELTAKNQILATNLDFSNFMTNARAALTNHRGQDTTIDFLTGSTDYLDRLNARLIKPALNVVADQATRYRNIQFNPTNRTGHGSANYPYQAMLPVTNPLTQSGFAAGPIQASHGDINRYYGWALQNKASLSEEASSAINACARNTAEFHLDFTQIEHEITTRMALRGITGQLSPSVVRSIGPEAVEAYMNDTAFYTDGVQGFADDVPSRDARIKLLAFHYGLEPGNDLNSRVYARVAQNLLETRDFVTDKEEWGEITQEAIDDYAKFYQGRYLRSGLRRNARRDVFTARKEQIYSKLADEYEGSQISSVELQRRLKADLVKEVMRGRFQMIEKLASQREADDDAGIFKRFGSKIEGFRRKLTANPVKRFIGNLAVGGTAVTIGALATLGTGGALAVSAAGGLAARGLTMTTLDAARAKLSSARGNRTVNRQVANRNYSTGRRGPVNVRNARGAQKSLIKQISLGHDVNAEFDFDERTGEFTIDSETYTGQLERSTALWKAESQQVEQVVDAQIRTAVAAGSNMNSMDVIVNSMNALYGNGGLEDVFMQRLEREMINRRTMLNLNQVAALGVGGLMFTVLP